VADWDNFLEACVGGFSLGNLLEEKQFRRAESLGERLSFKVLAPSGEWFLEAFREPTFLAPDIRFLCEYARRLASHGLGPELRSWGVGSHFGTMELEGQTFRVTCRGWLRGERCGPDDWDEEYLAQVGQLLARMHDVTSGWQPNLSRVAWNFSLSAGQAVERIRSWGLVELGQAAFLERVTDKIEKALTGLDMAHQTVIHGDPWYGNLLRCHGGLKAVDLSACGFGPRVGDIAVWFYWMVLSLGPERWAEPFDALLSAYESIHALDDRERFVIPHLACLRHLWFLVAEVEERMVVSPKDRHAIDFYIQDHVSAVRTVHELGVLEP
jgi:Ser/Thr protein kinase RdoA (MazF antagonist)